MSKSNAQTRTDWPSFVERLSISEAPRDGSWILAYDPTLDPDAWLSAPWVIAYTGEDGGWFVDGGYPVNPTSFLPLNPPPRPMPSVAELEHAIPRSDAVPPGDRVDERPSPPCPAGAGAFKASPRNPEDPDWSVTFANVAQGAGATVADAIDAAVEANPEGALSRAEVFFAACVGVANGALAGLCTMHDLKLVTDADECFSILLRQMAETWAGMKGEPQAESTMQ